MSTTPVSPRKKVTVATLAAKKAAREPITMLTAYDYATALAMDAVGIDVVLVGDSVGMVVLGHETTLPVTMDAMLHHSQAVARGARAAHLVGDMPFMSYQVSPEEAVRNAGRFLQEAHMDAVKLEGGREVIKTVEAIVRAGIPVMGHLGLTPQSVHKLGGFKVQGRSVSAARHLIDDAERLQDAGCYAVVLEAIPDRVAGLITDRLGIVTIGIGAGAHCDGQVLVTHDVLGLFERFTPKFVRKYADLHGELRRALTAYAEDVRARRFPDDAHSHAIDDAEFAALLSELKIEPAP